MTDNMKTILDLMPSLTIAQLGHLRDEARCLQEEQLRQAGVTGDLTSDEREAVQRNDLMSAVRSIRDRTGLGLRDSKAYLDKARGMTPTTTR